MKYLETFEVSEMPEVVRKTIIDAMLVFFASSCKFTKHVNKIYFRKNC